MRNWLRKLFATPGAYRKLLVHCQTLERAVKALSDENEVLKHNAGLQEAALVKALAQAAAAEALRIQTASLYDKGVDEALMAFDRAPSRDRMNATDRNAVIEAIAHIGTTKEGAA